LEGLCADDPDLRRQLDQLFANSPSEGKGFVDNPPFGEVLAQFTASGRRLGSAETLASRFEIIRHLGSGGMGEVYEAEDRHLHARVAIKLIRRDVADQADALARFRREIALARQVTHRSVCRVFDFFPESPTSRGDRVDFLTMELLHGETLAELLEREAPISLERALPILSQLTAALDAAHAAGVLHRDMKGSNIFLTKDAEGMRVVITDFGLARSAGGGDSVSTGSAWGAGTPLFMSPEQLEGGELGPQSDLYSLGVLMFQMATGAAPLQGHSPLQIAIKRVKEQPKSPRDRNPNIDPAWESAILRCLALHPKERYRTGAEVLAALGRPRNAFRIPKKPVLIGIAALALSAGGWWIIDRFSAPPIRPEVARWYREGEVALADGAMTKASNLFQRALKTDPNFLSARCRLAEAYIELDMRDRAQEEILLAVSARPRSSEERLLCEGVKATLTGQWDQALAAARDRGNAQLDEARWNERAGRSEIAAGIYESLIKADNSQPGAQLRLANIRIRQGKDPEAAALLNSADVNYRSLGNSEGQGEVRLARARIAATVTESIRLAEDAIARSKESASDWLRVRSMLWQAGRVEMQGDLAASRRLALGAIEIAEHAGLAGQAVNGIIDLGYVPFAQGKYEEAEPEFRRALQLAQRYRAQRAEARARLTLAQWHMVQNQLPQAGPLIDEALAHYRATGDVVQIAQTLRYRGDLLEKSGKFDEAHATFTEAIAASPAANDQFQARQRLAFLARQRTRYEEAAARFAEVVDHFEKSGNRVSAQNFRIEKAKALTLCGRFADAEWDLELIRREKPANEKVQWQLDQAQSTLDFQQMKFDVSLARLEAMRAAAAKRGSKSEELSVRYELCSKYAEAGKPAQAAALCDAVKKEFAGRPAQLVGPFYAMAEVHMARREPGKAVAQARQAVALAEQLKDLRNTWYTLLILTESLHLAGNPEWKQTRERARGVFAEIARDGGETATKSYFSRPLIARRNKAVESLQ